MSTYASPTDTAAHGEYSIRTAPDDPRPRYRFSGRITRDGSSPFPAAPGRYHLYAGKFCPWAQRSVLVIELAGIADAVSVSYVDNTRDARGWAFREEQGPDPVNGFTLLREAYEATEPGFDGHVSVPTLWDRVTGTVVSNDFGLLDVDLATQLDGDGVDLYPEHLRAEIDELEAWIRPTVDLDRFADRLAGNRYLLGDRLTLADIRLWVMLVRVPPVGHPALSAYADRLHALPAFARTTFIDSFVTPTHERKAS